MWHPWALNSVLAVVYWLSYWLCQPAAWGNTSWCAVSSTFPGNQVDLCPGFGRKWKWSSMSNDHESNFYSYTKWNPHEKPSHRYWLPVLQRALVWHGFGRSWSSRVFLYLYFTSGQPIVFSLAWMVFWIPSEILAFEFECPSVARKRTFRVQMLLVLAAADLQLPFDWGWMKLAVLFWTFAW